MKNLCIILVSISFGLSANYASSHTPIDRDWYGFISSMYYDQGNGNITPGDDQVDRKRRHKRRRKVRPSKKGLDR